MKRFFVSLIASFLAFTAGLVTAASWTSERNRETVESVVAAEPCPPPSQPEPRAPVQSFTVTPPHEFDFGQNGLKLVPERVQLKSESLRYDIDVSYPQIVGAEDSQLWKVNQHIKDEATKLYQWPLNPGKSASEHSGLYNTVNFTYQSSLATDAFLSISFIGYTYGANPGNQAPQSFSVNYDLTSGKPLKLSDIFKRDSKYLEFISKYCIDVLSRNPSSYIKEGLSPTAANFENWHITTKGVMFEFPACKVRNCSDGDQSVEIPFSDLEAILNPGIPGKFKITYP